MSEFSVESILFKDDLNNSFSSGVKVKNTKSMDELAYEMAKSEEDLKFFETYSMINDYNTNQKLRMLKRLNNVTNRIKNRNISNSCESYINSIVYSLEDDKLSGKSFAKRVWETIVTFAQKVLNMIVNAVKYVINALLAFGNKKHLEVYKEYVKKSIPADKLKEIDKVDLKCRKFKIKYSELSKFVDNFAKAYGDSVNLSAYDGIMKETDNAEATLSKLDSVNMSDEAQYAKIYEKYTDELQRAKIIALNKLFNISGSNEITTEKIKDVLASLFYDKNSEGMTCGKMKELTNNFACFKDEGILNKLKTNVKSMKEQQKKYTEYVKKIKKLTETMTKELIDEGKKDIRESTNKEYKKEGRKALRTAKRAFATAIRDAANTLIKYNMFWNSLSLDFERHTIIYLNSAYKAMKRYMGSAE